MAADEAADDRQPAGAAAAADEAAALARRSADAMFAADRASQALGMEITRVGPGTATLQMTVRDDMVNGHGICHGGYMFLLADSAFAFACNSYNRTTVAAHADISFLKAVAAGDILIAECREVHRAGRSGVYDVTVANQNGELVAVFRGRSRTIRGTVVPQD